MQDAALFQLSIVASSFGIYAVARQLRFKLSVIVDGFLLLLLAAAACLLFVPEIG